MRYLKKQVLNRRAPADDRLAVDVFNGVIMNTTNNLLLPKGTSSQYPTTPLTGMIRYNTTADQFEGYQNGTWRAFRFKEATQITQQSLGNIDGFTYFYGPLSPTPPSVVQSGTTWSGANIFVIVENVIQIFNTNYAIAQNPTASMPTTLQANAGSSTLTVANTSTIPTGSIVTGSPYLQSNTVATVTSATTISLSKVILGGNIPSSTTVTFTAPTGYYLNFTSDPYYSGLTGKPITVLHGFDK